ncbi:phage tail protein [Trabulsiella guamensis ATCC 49490]|uniref:Phage tail protein n=1 Tax=Trabulsiella guamensis ATCC 49490 TaxID=1005994 RepID=A0A085ARU2_9ENTR|nr:phage tail protein [Trabulsiella guamensis]KFC12937.1 phage tail protein [Trabulsiella guamensis ATCC 49490]
MSQIIDDITAVFSTPQGEFEPSTGQQDDAARVLMSWGDFEFSVDNLAYSTLSRSAEWRWSAQELIGKRDQLQFTGKSTKTVNIEGEAYSGFGAGPEATEALFQQADLERPLLLVSGLGDIFGYWVVTSFTDTATSLLPGGGARRRSFRIEMKYYGEELQDE